MTDELKVGENHPATHDAFAWIKQQLTQNPTSAFMLKEALASLAIENNRLAEICLGTLDRILEDKPVGERYVLGLAWILLIAIDVREAKEREKQESECTCHESEYGHQPGCYFYKRKEQA